MNRRVAASLLLLMLCSACPAPSSGRLTVVVDTPGDVPANVTVSGPNGYTLSITTTEMLTGLAEGEYRATGEPLVVSGEPVSSVFQPAAVEIPVYSGTDSLMTVEYVQRPGSGAIWVADHTNSQLLGFSGAKLLEPSSPTADLALTFPSNTEVYGLAFDRRGNLWTSLSNLPARIIRLAPSHLGAGGATPAASLPTPGLPRDLVFDQAGNLWVTNQWTRRVERYAAASVAGEGELDVEPDLSFDNPRFGRFGGFAFDASGNLWVASTQEDRLQVLIRFTAAQIAGTGSLPITEDRYIVLRGSGDPLALAMDRLGNLWVALHGYHLLRFDAGDLPVAGPTTSPRYIINRPVDPSSPCAMAFDEAGSLWLADHDTGELWRYSASQLSGTGTSTTSRAVVELSQLARLNGLALSPAPSGLQLPR